MITKLATGIWNKFNGDSGAGGLNASGGLSEFAFQEATQAATSPYGVFYIDGITTEEYMGGIDDGIEQGEIRLQLFSTALDGGVELLGLIQKVQTLFDWATLTITDYTHIKMSRESIAPIIYADEVWQATMLYSVWFVKT